MARRSDHFKETVNRFMDRFIRVVEEEASFDEFDDPKAISWLQEKLEKLKYENRPADVS